MNSEVESNISNAFEVVAQTYQNIDKLFSCFKNLEQDNEVEYFLAVPQFLNWHTDRNFWGWSIRSFYFLFQQKSALEFENGWKDGPIYAIEIRFWQPNEKKVKLIKYEYSDIKNWSSGCVPSNHFRFHQPIYEYYNEFNTKEGEKTIISIPEEARRKNHWFVEKITYLKEDLTNITSENFKDIIFKSFDLL